MTAFILFALATAEVKGFAFTLGIGVLVSLFTAVLATQAALGAMGRSKLVTHPAALGAGKQAQRLDLRLHGRLEVVLLPVGDDPADRRPGDRRQRPELRHRLQVRHPHPGRRSSKPVEHESEVGKRAGAKPVYGNAEVQKIKDASVGGNGLPDLDAQDAAPASVTKVEHGARRQASGPESRRKARLLLLDLDRTDLRENGRQERGDRDHRLAAGDLVPTSPCDSSGSTRCRC